MTETSRRTLLLLALLQARPDRTGPELVARLGVDARTVRRDVDRLRELGYHVVATRGRVGGYRLDAGAELPPLLLDDEQVVALPVALRTITASGVGDDPAEAAVRALTTVRQVLPAPPRHRVDAVAVPPAPAAPGPPAAHVDPALPPAPGPAAPGRAHLPAIAPGRLRRRAVEAFSREVAGDLAAARAALPGLPVRPRLAVAATVAVYERLLARLAATPPEDILRARVRIPDTMKVALAARAAGGQLLGQVASARSPRPRKVLA